MKTILTLLFTFSLAQATTVSFTTSAGTFTRNPNATTVTFDSLNAHTPSPYIVGDATFSNWNGSLGQAPFASGGLTGNYAQPPNDTTTFLAVGIPGRVDLITITFASPISYYGFYLWSPDVYNVISFWNDSTPVASFTGAQLLPPGNGDWSVAGYLNFTIHDGPVNRVVMGSSQPTVETDNHAYVLVTPPPVAAPEPATFVLIGGALLALVWKRRQ